MWFYLILLLCSVVYIYSRHKYSYWKKRNVPYMIPVFPFGNLNRSQSFNKNDRVGEIYTRFKNSSPLVGMYFFLEPTALILDLGLIKSILVSNFSIFTDRQQYVRKNKQPLLNHLFNMRGHDWKLMRNKLSPSFTSGKMKWMFPTIVDVANQLKSLPELQRGCANVVNIRDISGRYTTDVIGSVVFGTECNSLKDLNGEAYRHLQQVVGAPRFPKIFRQFLNTYNKIGQMLGISLQRKDFDVFFTNFIKDIVHMREQNNIQRKDLMNLLIENKNEKDSKGLPGLTVNDIIGEGFVFFMAGYESSSSNMAFTVFELAKHPNFQDKARDEINKVIENHNNQLTYEAVSEMTYLQQCMNETLRKYPAIPFLSRVAKEDFKVPGTEIIVEKGTSAIIPVLSIHHDENIYPNPSEYNPERFTKENIQARDPMTFLAFGEGPRNCIGMRLGRLQTSIGLITLLRSFKFSFADKTPETVTVNPNALTIMADGPLLLKVEKL